MNWSDLAAAFALYLVLEGILPFLNPAGFRRVMLRLAGTEEAQLRVAGALSMVAGLVLLYFVRG